MSVRGSIVSYAVRYNKTLIEYSGTCDSKYTVPLDTN
jgi:hypothetical protein